MSLSKKCLICKGGRKNDCLHWHLDKVTGEPWVWCVGKCKRRYTIQQYCETAGVDINEFIKGGIEIEEEKDNEVQVMPWPARFIPLSDPRAASGVEYIKSRGLTLDGDMYYDIERDGIVFPYYFGNHFCGAQTRYITPRIREDGTEQKIDTIPGSRLGLLFYGWNQGKFMGSVKGIIVTEGAFNSISIMQSLNRAYGGISNNPWRAVACSGSGANKHQKETLKELKEQGKKIILAPDSDEAGLDMLEKFRKSDVATHYALTEDTDKDWNDALKELGHEDFARYFLSRIKAIDV